MSGKKLKEYPVLLAGGSGSRLWPLSRELFPKQLINLVDGDSLIQNTVKRLSPVFGTDRVRVVCGEEHLYEIARHIEAIGVSAKDKIITEPCGRNTAPAVLLTMLTILKREKDAVLLLFPADHVIRDLSQFHEKLNAAVQLAMSNYIVTFGIKPGYPETGYGYIEGTGRINGGALRIRRFIEKPNRKTAEEYCAAGNFFWNSGMFAFKASVMLKEFKRFEPKLLKEMQHIIASASALSRDMYAKLPDISLDYAIMERTDRGAVLPSDFGWSDIGSWKSLYDLLPKDAANNVIEGDVILRDSRNCFIKGDERLTVVNGLKNIVVIETPDTVLVSDMQKSRDVKAIVSDLKRQGRKEYKAHTTVYRPWGTYKILEEKGNSKMKRIVIYPGAKLSLQMHYHRSEHWVVVQGTAKIINGDQTIFLEENQSTYIPKATTHRLENPGKVDLHIIEVQIGDYLEEDDIVRFDDDFGRVDKEKKTKKR